MKKATTIMLLFLLLKSITFIGQTTTNKKFIVQMSLKMPGNDSTGGLIVIKKNGVQTEEIKSEGTGYLIRLDLNAYYLIECSKKGYTTKIIYFDTKVPNGRAKEEFAYFLIDVELFKNAKGEKNKPTKPIGGVKYNPATEDFDKVQ